MAQLRPLSNIAVLGMFVMVMLACGHSSNVPSAKRRATHCQRDLSAERVCTEPITNNTSRRDTDRDGIPDARDCCPKLPEDADGFDDHDGCPDCDDDQDGILDAEWLMAKGRRHSWSSAEGSWGGRDCSAVAEDFNGIDDEDGCPDGVEIVLDSTTCVEMLRQRSTRAMHHGAPVFAFLRSPVDTDGDGYDDDVDECRTAWEDFDGFEDEDGCPDCDNDQDGIPDADVWVLFEWGPGWANRDATGNVDCRNEPEDLDGDRDEDGCPDE